MHDISSVLAPVVGHLSSVQYAIDLNNRATAAGPAVHNAHLVHRLRRHSAVERRLHTAPGAGEAAEVHRRSSPLRESKTEAVGVAVCSHRRCSGLRNRRSLMRQGRVPSRAGRGILPLILHLMAGLEEPGSRAMRTLSMKAAGKRCKLAGCIAAAAVAQEVVRARDSRSFPAFVADADVAAEEVEAVQDSKH